MSSASAAVRATVSTWQFRSLSLQDSFALTQSLTLLEAHEASLYDYSPHAPRLLANLRAELATREPGAEPRYCYRSKHTLPAQLDPGRVACVVCGCIIKAKVVKRLAAA